MGFLSQKESLLRAKQAELQEIGHKIDLIEHGFRKFNKQAYHDLINQYFNVTREIESLESEIYAETAVSHK